MIRNIVEVDIALGFEIRYLDLDSGFDQPINYIYSSYIKTEVSSYGGELTLAIL